MITQFIKKYKHTQSTIDIPFNNINVVRIFTDGSCSKNGYSDAVGGFASIIVSGYNRHNMLFGMVEPKMLSTSISLPTQIIKPTNIRAEGFAILNALNELHHDIDNADKWKEAIFYSDSEFWINMITKWMPTWPTSKFMSGANPDLTISIRDMWNVVNEKKKVSIMHVYAHNKDMRASDDLFTKFTYHNNDLADALAFIARTLPDYNPQRLIITP